jgi:hypothetical protein
MSVGWCDGMNPNTRLGVGVLMDPRIFKENFQRSKLIELKNYLYHWNFFGTNMSKMGLHIPLEYLKPKLWPKERPRVKLAI